jgi:hypothetical protein
MTQNEFEKIIHELRDTVKEYIAGKMEKDKALKLLENQYRNALKDLESHSERGCLYV